tara:strand:+ start:14 stop:208 length:195 start_codon:yes stop_codon:yes gene_type:complete
MRPIIGGLLISCFLILFFSSFSWAQVVFGEYSVEELAFDTVSFEPEAKIVALYEAGVSMPIINT